MVFSKPGRCAGVKPRVVHAFYANDKSRQTTPGIWAGRRKCRIGYSAPHEKIKETTTLKKLRIDDENNILRKEKTGKAQRNKSKKNAGCYKHYDIAQGG